MSQIIRGVRHTGVVGKVGASGFKPYYSTSDAIRQTKPAPKRAPVKDAAAKVVAALGAIARRVDAVGTKFGKVSDSLDGAAHNARQIADRRRASGFHGRV